VFVFSLLVWNDFVLPPVDVNGMEVGTDGLADKW